VTIENIGYGLMCFVGIISLSFIFKIIYDVVREERQ